MWSVKTTSDWFPLAVSIKRAWLGPARPYKLSNTCYTLAVLYFSRCLLGRKLVNLVDTQLQLYVTRIPRLKQNPASNTFRAIVFTWMNFNLFRDIISLISLIKKLQRNRRIVFLNVLCAEIRNVTGCMQDFSVGPLEVTRYCRT